MGGCGLGGSTAPIFKSSFTFFHMASQSLDGGVIPGPAIFYYASKYFFYGLGVSPVHAGRAFLNPKLFNILQPAPPRSWSQGCEKRLGSMDGEQAGW